MSLAERMQSNNFIVNGGPHRCVHCNKTRIFCVQKIDNEFFVGPICSCEPSLKKKYTSKIEATNALFNGSYRS